VIQPVSRTLEATLDEELTQLSEDGKEHHSPADTRYTVYYGPRTRSQAIATLPHDQDEQEGEGLKDQFRVDQDEDDGDGDGDCGPCDGQQQPRWSPCPHGRGDGPRGAGMEEGERENNIARVFDGVSQFKMLSDGLDEVVLGRTRSYDME
jgi:hypothetical protein